MSPAASAAATSGCSASRRTHPTAPAAAPRVMRVRQRSHVRALPCPSASKPPQAVNADISRERAAVCRASARSSASNEAACSSLVSSVASAVAR